VTVLFADIRGFTAMTEKAAAHDIVRAAERVLRVMVEVLFRFDGTLDKYVGDEIMPSSVCRLSNPDAPHLPCSGALEMQKRALRVSTARATRRTSSRCTWASDQHRPGGLGAIRLSTKTLQYTVIGDTVNTARASARSPRRTR